MAEKTETPAEHAASEAKTHGDTNTAGGAQQAAFNKLHSEVVPRSDAGAATHVDEGFENHYTAMRQATGMDNTGAAQGTNNAARDIDASSSRAEGVSRGQTVSYTDSSGQSIKGGQYTNSDGTYFKTTTGDTYKVQPDQSGGYRLDGTKPGQESIDAPKVQVLSNSFGNRSDAEGAHRAVNSADGADGANRVVNRSDSADSVDSASRAAAASRAQIEPTDSTTKSGGTRIDGVDGADRGDGANRGSTRSDASDAPNSSTRNQPNPAEQPIAQKDVPAAAQKDVPPVQRPDGGQPEQRPEGSQSAQRPEGSQSAQRPEGSQSAQRPEGSQSEQRPEGSQSAQRPEGSQSAQRPEVQPEQRPEAQPAQRPDGADRGDGGANRGGTRTDGSDAPTSSTRTQPNPTEQQPVAQPQKDFQPVPRDLQAPLPKDAQVVRADAPAVDANKLNHGAMPVGADGKPLIGQVSVDKIGQVSDLSPLTKGQINPADFVKGADGKVLPVQDNIASKTAAGADQQGGALGALKDGSDPARLANPALRTMVPGFDLTDGQNRAMAADIMRQMQTTKDGGADFKLQDFQALTKGMDASKVENLQAFLFPGGKNQVNDQAAGRLTALLAGHDTVTGSGALDQSKALVIGQLSDLAKGNSLADLAGQSKDSHALMMDIGKVMQDTNKLLTMDGKDALTLAQLISRTPLATKGGELSLEGKGPLDGTHDPTLFVIKGLGAQDPLTRLLNEKAQLAALEGKGLTLTPTLAGLDGPTKALNQADMPGARVQIDTSRETKADAQKDKEIDEKVAGKLVPGAELDGVKKPAEEKEKEDKKEDYKHEMDERAKQEAFLALMAEKKLKEQKEKEEKEKERQQQAKKDEESRRRRYIVKENDTLESIATKQLKDVKLAALIYDINRSVIQSKKENDKDVVDLRVGLVIWLPSTSDIAKFRKEGVKGVANQVSADEELRKRFGQGWDGTAAGAKPDGIRAGLVNSSNVADETRRENIEKMLGSVSKRNDGQLKYVVRLGDSLKSVAMKHPALQDVALWRLLASVNGLDESTDEKGSPTVRLSRGSTLTIPETEQIEEYCNQHGMKVRRNSGPGKICDSCKAVNTLGTTICGACGHVFAAANPRQHAPKLDNNGTKSGGEMLQKESLDSLVAEPISLTTVQELYAPDSQLTVTHLDDQSRLTRCELPGDPESLVVTVEVLHETSWQAVIAYEIHPLYSIRFEFSPDGNRRGVRIDIPMEAAMTLSANDLNSNWRNYRDRYSAHIVSLRR